MRIISGIAKGKKILIPTDNKTRPLKDMVKESIFNILNHSNLLNSKLNESIVLDLFSGVGSFGLEAISRGAKKVVFFENYPEAIKILEKNLNLLKNLNNHKIYKKNFFNFFSSNKSLNFKFNIIFIDPPYKETKINEIIELILEKKILTQNGILIIHRHKKDNIKLTNKLRIIEDRYYGISKILFGN